jgi:general secretion pathway protein E/type IV pilus assembly protein PilB
MGVEPYLVASALEGVLAQRLVRVLCGKCKEVDISPAALAFKKDIGLPADLPLYRPVGCETCRNTGFYGRRGTFELMSMNDEIRQLILASRSTGEIREAARRDGLSSLTEDGWRLVSEGATTVDEVLRVTKDERLNSNGLLNGHSYPEGKTSGRSGEIK